MNLALYLLIFFLIFLAPLTIFFDGPVIQGLIAAVAATSVAIVGLRIRPGESDFLSAVIGPTAVLATIPAVWMLLQVMPLENVGLVHPVWKSAVRALERPLIGSISIDPGATLMSLVRYLSAASIAFVAAAVSVDRKRAEWILFSLTTAITLIALMALMPTTILNMVTTLATKFDTPLTTIGEGAPSRIFAADSAGLGIIFAAVSALHAFERYRMGPPFAASCAALAICVLAFIVGTPSQNYFAIICSIAVIAIVLAIRRFSLGPWGTAAITSTAFLVAIAVIMLQARRAVDFTIAFGGQAPASLTTVTQRILTDTNWLGTGAGTFSALLPIYQGMDEQGIGPNAPTAAAAIAVEMGRPFFWALMMATIALFTALLRGALQRHRDPYYSLAGASYIMAVALLSFSDTASLGTSMSTIAAVAIGLALAQSKSRLIS